MIGLFVYPPVALTAMGKPLFNAPGGGYYDLVRVAEDSTQSGLQQGPEISMLVEQKVRPCLRRSGYAQAGRSLSERPAHVRMIENLCNIWVYTSSGFYLMLCSFYILTSDSLHSAYFMSRNLASMALISSMRMKAS